MCCKVAKGDLKEMIKEDKDGNSSNSASTFDCTL